MPNRILKETICTSCEVDSLTVEEERFFYRLIVQCDDFGRMDARPAIIRAKCFPLKLDSVKDKDVSKWLGALVGKKLVLLYEVENKPYLQMATWDKHQQKRAKYSKYPAPDEGVISDDINCNQLQSNVTENTRNEKRETRNDHKSDFEEFWNHYPRHKEKQAAFTKWKSAVKEDKPTDIIAAARNYAAECRGKEEKFVKLAKTFLGPDKHYREYINVAPPEPLAPYHKIKGRDK